MIEFIGYFSIALVFSLIGFYIGKLLSKLNLEKEKTSIEKEKSALETKVISVQEAKELLDNNYIELQKDVKSLQQEKEDLLVKNTNQNSEILKLEEKLSENKSEIEKLQEKFTKEFENLANKILDEKSNKFTEQNKENLKTILNPLQEKIKIFEDKVDKTHKESIDYHAALRQQILGLKELNQQMSKETLNLTKALKGDSKTQGNWGELVLERVLEKSGLEKDREYFVQQSFTNEEGKKILPDVVIHLPDNKKMIVDSKVSLTAYEQFVNEDDDTTKEQHLKNHVTSLKRHIEQLSDKKYEEIYKIESPDFVLLFIPIEPAFAIALNFDNQLYNKAFEKYVDKFWELIDILLNAILFVLIGMEMLVLVFNGTYILAGLIAIPVVLVCRYISLFLPIKLFRDKLEFVPKTDIIMTWGGLRGGISIALALGLSTEMNRELFLVVTYIVVVFSIIFQGLSVGKLVEKLK